MIKRTFASFFALIVFSALVFAQAADTPQLDKLLEEIAANNKGMGSLAVARNGQNIYSRSFGYRSVEDNAKASVETRYRIGSISKTFTSVMILQLAEKKKLTLDTTLDKFFPQVPNASKITIRQLLNHSSGVFSITSAPDYLEWYTKPQTQADMLKRIYASKPDFEPGAKHQYSNSGYILLGYIIEKVTKKPYSAALDQMITKKAGLSFTSYGGKINAANNEGYSYAFDGKWSKLPETDMSVPHGAGALISTPGDLVKFAHALFSNKLISAASLAEMKKTSEGYGLGMFENKFGTAIGYGHTGGIDGFTSQLVYFPADGTAVAYCSNGSGYENEKIVGSAYDVMNGKKIEMPNFKTIAVPESELDAVLGTYSSPGFPLKVTFTKNDGTLVAQATGQGAFPLEAVAKNKFKFDPAGVVVEFNPEKGTMTLYQGGRTVEFTREK